MRQFLLALLLSLTSLHAAEAILMTQIHKRHQNYSQEQILTRLHKKHAITGKLRKKDRSSIESLIILLGLKAEKDGYLDPKADAIFNTLPSNILSLCTKTIRRTWLLDEHFCKFHIPAKIYALSPEEILDVKANTEIHLKKEMLQKNISGDWNNRNAYFSGKSKFNVPFDTIRSSHGNLLDRFDKKCILTGADEGYIEILQLQKLNWKDLFLLHRMGLGQSIQAGHDIQMHCEQLIKKCKNIGKENKISCWEYVRRLSVFKKS